MSRKFSVIYSADNNLCFATKIILCVKILIGFMKGPARRKSWFWTTKVSNILFIKTVHLLKVIQSCSHRGQRIHYIHLSEESANSTFQSRLIKELKKHFKSKGQSCSIFFLFKPPFSITTSMWKTFVTLISKILNTWP